MENLIKVGSYKSLTAITFLNIKIFVGYYTLNSNSDNIIDIPSFNYLLSANFTHDGDQNIVYKIKLIDGKLHAYINTNGGNIYPVGGYGCIIVL